MAKKDKEDKKNGGEGLGSKLLTLIIVLLIVIIWLAIIALLIKFDVGGLGSNETVQKVFKDIPVLNMILPDSDPTEDENMQKYNYKNLEEAIAAIKKLEQDVDKLKEENDAYSKRIQELQTENETLSHYEAEYLDFLKQKEQFDREIALGEHALSRNEYIKWYEKMYPENAEKIYAELKGEEMVDEAYTSVASYLAKTSSKADAQILMEYTSDIDFVCNVLKCLKTAKVAEILEAMQKDGDEGTLFASRIINRMHELGLSTK